VSAWLAGPYPLDYAGLTGSARHAFAVVGAALRQGEPGAVRAPLSRSPAPGLYVLIREDVEPAIAGFWVVFDEAFLEEGMDDRREAAPGLVGALLEGLVEEVWWTWPVADRARQSWRPLVILEWPPALAIRSDVVLPGDPSQVRVEEAQETEEVEEWLDSESLGLAAPGVRSEPRPMASRGSARRSILTVIQGELRYTGSRHEGTWRVLQPDELTEGGEGETVPLDGWLSLAVRPVLSAPDASSSPALILPHQRLGHPVAGWLLRDLRLWPRSPSELAAGNLRRRSTRARWQSRAWAGASSMLMVLVSVLVLTAAVQQASKPWIRAAPKAPAPAAHPIVSVCSPDHQRFVEELRCQLAAIESEGLGGGGPVCYDDDSGTPPPPNYDDLQPVFCGLLDRELDGWMRGGSPGTNYAESAVAAACFNVLGHPFTYADVRRPPGSEGARAVADPDRLLRDPALRIQSLVDLYGELEGICDANRTRLQRHIEGSVLATHVGGPDEPEQFGLAAEAGALRGAALEVASAGLSAEQRRCVAAGGDGVDGLPGYGWICNGEGDGEYDDVPIWAALGPRPEAYEGGDLVERYTSARFGTGSPEGSDDVLWRCHLALRQTDSPLLEVLPLARWEVFVSTPAAYDVRGGGVRTQLQLDAALRGLEADWDGGTCWGLVARQLSAYAPVHPLAELEEKGWPSQEQQLCGQVCAGNYNLISTSDSWLTPSADLAMCLDASPLPTDEDTLGKLGSDALDRLRVPWSGPEGRWKAPAAHAICAFNLIAQSAFDDAPAPVLVSDADPRLWAGETSVGSRMAGGEDGRAHRAVERMSRYGAGAGFGVDGCSDVAAQCFLSALLKVTGGEYSGASSYRWFDAWQREVESIASLEPAAVASRYPWCAPIQEYLVETREKAQIDAPCLRGVHAARERISGAALTLAGRSEGGP